MAGRIVRFLGAALALAACCGAAAASDFLVLSSNDAMIAKGARLSAGQQLALVAGKSLTVMGPSGEVVRLTGGPQGVRLPSPAGAAPGPFADVIQKMVSRPGSRSDFGTMRGKDKCPVTPESLTTAQAIAAAYENPECRGRAREALERLIEAAPTTATSQDTPAAPQGS